MNSDIRRKLEMAARARDFSLAHPSPEPSYATILGRLEERITRAEALATQQRSGVLAVRASTARRKELRERLNQSLLKHLVRCGEAASKEQPELARRFQLPHLNVTQQTYLTAAHAMVAEAQAQKELFLRHGMATTLLEDLTAALTEYGDSVEQIHTGRRDHVGASADLKAVTGEVMDLVGLLDGLNRYRFRDDPEQRAAWDSAQNVVGPMHPKASPPEEGGIKAAA